MINIECLTKDERLHDETGQRKVRATSSLDILRRGCLSGVEPPPSGSQPDVQKPLHHRHRNFRYLEFKLSRRISRLFN